MSKHQTRVVIYADGEEIKIEATASIEVPTWGPVSSSAVRILDASEGDPASWAELSKAASESEWEAVSNLRSRVKALRQELELADRDMNLP